MRPERVVPDPLLMEDALRELRAIVDDQSEDVLLWLGGESAACVEPLRSALRLLHYMIERETRWI